MKRSRLGRVVLTAVLALLFGSASTCPFAAATTTGPVWELRATSPSHVTPGSSFTYLLEAADVGDEPSSGEYTLHATLPSGLTVA